MQLTSLYSKLKTRNVHVYELITSLYQFCRGYKISAIIISTLFRLVGDRDDNNATGNRRQVPMTKPKYCVWFFKKNWSASVLFFIETISIFCCRLCSWSTNHEAGSLKKVTGEMRSALF